VQSCLFIGQAFQCSIVPIFQYQRRLNHTREGGKFDEISLFTFAGVLLFQVGVAGAQQFPLMDKLADKVIQKYQTSSCQELMQKKSQPQPAKQEMIEEKALAMLRKDPQMRTEFLNRVAGPIANKMFECGMIP